MVNEQNKNQGGSTGNKTTKFDCRVRCMPRISRWKFRTPKLAWFSHDLHGLNRVGARENASNIFELLVLAYWIIFKFDFSIKLYFRPFWVQIVIEMNSDSISPASSSISCTIYCNSYCSLDSAACPNCVAARMQPTIAISTDPHSILFTLLLFHVCSQINSNRIASTFLVVSRSHTICAEIAIDEYC